MQDGSTHPMVAARAPGVPAMRVPTKVAALMAMGPGGHLGNGHKVCKLSQVQPAVKGDHLVLDQWHGGISASETECANLKKA